MYWRNKTGTMFGWIDRGPQTRGRPVLELSWHSRRDLARENNSRLLTEEISKYIVKE